MRDRQGEAGEGAGPLIDGRYLVRTDRPLAEFAGLPAFAVEARHAEAGDPGRGGGRSGSPLLAVRTRRDVPPPANLPSFLNAYNTTLLMPFAHGAGADDYWVVCDAPTGPSLREALAERPVPLPEAEMVAVFLRPLALALGRLHALGLAHRGVRPANLYRSKESGRVLLAPGCVLPPAFAQPALYEPPSVGICPAAARGAGSAADDTYALGVVLLELALGRPPMPGLDDEQIVRRKIELGSFQALTAGERLSPTLLSLLRSMLSDDPQGRPDLAVLAENGMGAERPKAPRPEPRSPRPLMVGRSAVSTARTLALAFARQPAESLALLRSGAIDQWLRRALEQPLVAGRIDEALRGGRDRIEQGSEPMMLMQAIALLDPLAPMFWCGRWFWPDAVPAMLALHMAEGENGDPIGEAVRQGALRRWAVLTGRSVLIVTEELERRSARAARLPVPALRLSMLAYSLNPFLACSSPALGGACVLHADQLVEALEAKLPAGGLPSTRILDTQMLALLAARSDAPGAMAELTVPADADERLLDLQALAQAQMMARSAGRGVRARPMKLPRLGAALLPMAAERLNGWPGKGRRARRLARLEEAAAEGDLVAMLELSCQDTAWAADDAAMTQARQEADTLRRAHRASFEAGPMRAAAARQAGREVAVIAGVVALVGAVAAGIVS